MKEQKPPDNPLTSHGTALKIVGAYVLVGGAWIYLSDSFLGMMVQSPDTLTRLATVKGLLFIAVTAGVLYAILQYYIMKYRKAEEEAKLSTTHLHYLSKYADDFIILLDENFRFLKVNERVVDSYGYTQEELLGMHASQLRAPESREDFADQIKLAQISGKAFYETMHQCKDGRKFPVEISLHAIDDNGKTLYQAVIRDITQRIETERALQESERKYRELVEHANSIILHWSHDGRVTFLNEFGQRFFGYSEKEIIGRHVMGTIVPTTDSTGRDLRLLMDRICADPVAFEQNINENMRRNGQRVWIAWTNRIVMDAEGRVTEIQSVGTDITQLKRVEKALKDGEAHYRYLFEQNPVPMLIYELGSLAMLAVNDAFIAHYGYTKSEALALHLTDLYPDSEKKAITELTGRLQGHAYVGEWHHVKKDGTVLTIEAHSHGFDYEGRPSRIAVITDITERKRAQEELEKYRKHLEDMVQERTAELAVARDRAEAADRLKSAFLATMSHELRTPLNSIIGFTGILLQGLAGPLNAEQRKQLDMVRDSARHLLALINDVLDISKIEAGQLEVNCEPFDLRASIAKVAGIVGPLAERKHLVLKVTLAPEIGTVESDPRRIEQVLLNLLNNAVKFTEQGTVTLTAQIVPGALCISVADTGIGIKPEDMSKLFQPFRQIDSGLSRQHEGTGLGLAICRRLAELLGGEIHATSEWGKGSVFTLRLPMKGTPIS